ncbi:helix-turn-helix transcriptional regulator [Paenibacillus thermotolerans]|uniref:helix-turn-helix transcriptional regulator n=1 Tax=Paenibacillus thermotolerans TaxID=3027807 RepID=UPI00236746AF|nr:MULTISPECIES: helix-turn-helix transcriptional regulator [unclassified Paenibacillus]
MTTRYPEIDEVIEYISRNLYDPLPLSRLAGHVSYSPYHFARIFKERMGLPPLYYVSALRLQKAKELLLHTNLSVRDIALEVGQQSLGTFTTRFAEKVGIPPSQFRSQANEADGHFQSLRELSDWRDSIPSFSKDATIEGTLEAEVPFEGIVLIGLFAKPIPEGLPLRGTLVSSLGPFRLTGIKPGTYYLMATSVSWGTKAADMMLPQATLRTRSREPIVVGPYETVLRRVKLYLPRPDDPPILISLPLLMERFLHRNSQHHRQEM